MVASQGSRHKKGVASSRLAAIAIAAVIAAGAAGLARAESLAQARTGNAWACRKDRIDYQEAGKAVPRNDLSVGDTSVIVPAYKDPSGTVYPAARVIFTPPAARYVVGELVVLALTVEGGKGENITPTIKGFSQGSAVWLAKEIGGSNMMGSADYDQRHSRVSFAFRPKAQQGVDVVEGIPIPPLKHAAGVVGLVLWAGGEARTVTITWICRPE
ncbi:MAG: hypothetical protein KGL11_12660 [Alphaproteobacteria bacterium]|nr:hypothetical protein [Alphaproteobacteria bacterium]